MRWALGDNDGKGSTVIVQRWWEFAEIAVRLGIANALSGKDTQSTDNPESFGMDVGLDEKENAPSGREALAARRMNAILNQADPIVQYMTKRVCNLLREFVIFFNKVEKERVSQLHLQWTCWRDANSFSSLSNLWSCHESKKKTAHLRLFRAKKDTTYGLSPAYADLTW